MRSRPCSPPPHRSWSATPGACPTGSPETTSGTPPTATATTCPTTGRARPHDRTSPTHQHEESPLTTAPHAGTRTIPVPTQSTYQSRVADYWNAEENPVNLELGKLDDLYHHPYGIGEADRSVLDEPDPVRRRERITAELHRLEHAQAEFLTARLGPPPPDDRGFAPGGGGTVPARRGGGAAGAVSGPIGAPAATPTASPSPRNRRSSPTPRPASGASTTGCATTTATCSTPGCPPGHTRPPGTTSRPCTSNWTCCSPSTRGCCAAADAMW